MQLTGEALILGGYIQSMQLEVGSVLEGKVTGITKFGAFVQIPGGRTGMVHISEISNSYVKEISDHLSENDAVKVKVLAISEEGKISLSIKRCLEPVEQPAGERPARPPRSFDRGDRGSSDRGDRGSDRGEGRPYRSDSRPPRSGGGGIGWQPKRQPSNEGLSFEDMLTRFKQSSNDRMSDLKRNEPKRSRRGGGGNGGPPEE